MSGTFAIAQNGMVAGNKRQEIIANNISNLTTDGFRSQLAQQSDLLSPGTRIQGVHEDHFTVGAPEFTGEASNAMITGNGFFQVQLANGIGYTRAGNFSRDADGQLVAPSGHLLEPSITIPDDAIGWEIREDGLVIGVTPEGQEEELGQIELARFVNPAGLQSLGDNLYMATEASGQAETGTPGEIGFGGLMGRYVEGSNVDLTDQMGAMVVNQRYVQSTLRVFQTWDAMVGRALDTFS